VTRRPTLQRPEPQWSSGRWTVARQRPMRHAYLVIHGGQHVGWVAPVDGAWRWVTTWSPIDGGADLQQSRHAYSTWQYAVAALAATRVALAVTRTLDPPGDTWVRHHQARGSVWTPTPELAEVAR
jgi:hypothetical protein